jgi:hypothetical protein
MNSVNRDSDFHLLFFFVINLVIGEMFFEGEE